LQIVLEASFASGSAAAEVAIDKVYVEDGPCSNGSVFRMLHQTSSELTLLVTVLGGSFTVVVAVVTHWATSLFDLDFC